MEPVAREIQVGRMDRPIQVGKNVGNPFDLVGAYSARISLLEQPFQAPVTKRPDHLVYRTVYRYGCQLEWPVLPSLSRELFDAARTVASLEF